MKQNRKTRPRSIKEMSRDMATACKNCDALKRDAIWRATSVSAAAMRK